MTGEASARVRSPVGPPRVLYADDDPVQTVARAVGGFQAWVDLQAAQICDLELKRSSSSRSPLLTTPLLGGIENLSPSSLLDFNFLRHTD